MNRPSVLRRLFYLLAVITIAFGFLAPVSTVQAEGETPPEVAAAATPPPPEWQVTTNEDTGKVRFISTTADVPLLDGEIMAQGASEEDLVRQFLAQFGPQFGLSAAADLPITKVKTAEDGSQWYHFKQTYNGLPVVGGQIAVQVSPKNDVLTALSDVSVDLSLDTTPTISAAEARNMVYNRTVSDFQVKPEDVAAAEPILSVYDSLVFGNPGAPQKRLAWQVEVKPVSNEQPLPVNVFALVDAQDGKYLEFFNQTDAALTRTIYDCKNTPNQCTLARSEGGGSSSIDDVNKAYDFFGDVYNFYSTIHGRDSIDNNGMTLYGFTNFSEKAGYVYQNAFWDGKEMVFGQDMSDAEDVVAHELTHGVTDYESQLIYSYQSGAINEHLSDFWGELIELYYGDGSDRWWIGENIGPLNSSLQKMRYMADPPTKGNPDQMDSSYYYCSSGDNGGVHTNSGIGNKATFLALDGATFNGVSVTAITAAGGIGSTADQQKISKLAKIWYYAQANILTSASDWVDYTNALNTACTNLTGTAGIVSADCTTVSNALLAVEANTRPCKNGPYYAVPLVPVVTAPKGTLSSAPTEIVWDLAVNFQPTQYRLEFTGPFGWIVKDDLFYASSKCDTENCKYSIPTILVSGNYKWRVQAINPLGTSKWSAWTAFTVNTPAISSDTIVPAAPSGALNDSKPAFVWNHYTTSTKSANQYRLGVQKSGTATIKYSPWYPFSACSCMSGGTCTKEFPSVLVPGDYTGFVQAKGGSVMTTLGSGTAFTLGVLPTAATALVVSPADGSNAAPEFQWTRDANTTGFNLQIGGASGKIVRTLTSADANCDGDTSCAYTIASPAVPLNGGKHTWRVQATNGMGLGPWSVSGTFTINKPGTVTAGFDPTGGAVLTTNRPIFKWTAVAGNLARRYNIIVKNATTSAVVLNQWVNSETLKGVTGACVTSPCQVEASKALPLAGNYTWTVTGSNKAGLGTPSAAQTFTLPAGSAAPSAPTLVTPEINGRVASGIINLVFTRPAADVATQYHILLYSNKAKAYVGTLTPDYYYTPAALSCPVAGDTCTQSTVVSLPYGKYWWQVQAYNNGMNVASSNSPKRFFTVALTAPTLTNTIGGSDYEQNFDWTQNADATKYTLNIRSASATGPIVYNKSFLPAAICDSGSCSITSVPPLPDGKTYYYNLSGFEKIGGNGVPLTGSFADTNSDIWNFATSADESDWLDPYSVWAVNSTSPGYLTNSLTSSGAPETWLSSTAFNTSNFDFQASIKIGAPTSSAGVMVRGSLDGSNLADTGYEIDITNSKYFSIWSINGSVDAESTVQPWTYSPYIRGGAYNLIRVVGNGAKMYLYINDHLVWYHDNLTTYSTGTSAGLITWSSLYPVKVDYVRYYGLADFSVFSTEIDARQQQLNSAALEEFNKAPTQLDANNLMPDFKGKGE